MGLESELKKEMRLTALKRAIFASVQLAGFLTVVAMAPKVAALMGRAITRAHKNSMRSALRRMADKGFVKIDDGEVHLTQKGERYLDMYMGDMGEHTHKKKWDKKWRMVIFDIPERRRTLRMHLRAALMRIGFRRLQQSVWVYPYDREEIITLLKTEYHLGKEVLYVIADKIERDSELRRIFNIA
jgi:DNA-binding transcriptional regulator PaaX